MSIQGITSKLNSDMWMIEPNWFQSKISQIRIDSRPSGEIIINAEDLRIQSISRESSGPMKIGASLGLITISGPMQKEDDSRTRMMGFTSTNRVRQDLQILAADKDVKTILIHIESPGGNVSGTFELAEDVRMIARKKPVVAFIQDLGASAAYWVASQATQVIANEVAEVGSIGTVIVVPDFSKALADDGVHVHVISTGDMKGAFSFGSEVTDAQLEMLQTRIDDVNQKFLQAIMVGRNMSESDISKVNDGRVFIASKAKSLGLIDGISNIEKVVASIHSDFDKNKDNRRKMAEIKLRILES